MGSFDWASTPPFQFRALCPPPDAEMAIFLEEEEEQKLPTCQTFAQAAHFYNLPHNYTRPKSLRSSRRLRKKVLRAVWEDLAHFS